MFPEIAEVLRAAIQERITEESYDPFLAVKLSGGGDTREVRIDGTSDGLLFLAAECVRIAAAQQDWEHAHIDSGNIGDRNGMPLLVKRLKNQA